MKKPIRVFWSPLTGRFFASQAYREIARGEVLITGQKFDVTNYIASAITEHEITFTPSSKQDPPHGDA